MRLIHKRDLKHLKNVFKNNAASPNDHLQPHTLPVEKTNYFNKIVSDSGSGVVCMFSAHCSLLVT